MLISSDSRLARFFSRKKQVFAYGALLNAQTMRERCPSVQFKTRAVLPDYAVDFTRWAPSRQGGVLDVVPKSGANVWGVVYEISKKDLKRLDVFESCDKKDPLGYRRVRQGVYPNGDLNRAPILAETYEVKAKKPSIPPHPDYAQEVLEGAKNSRLPAAYIERLSAFIQTLSNKQEVNSKAEDSHRSI